MPVHDYKDIGLFDGKSGFLGAFGKIGRARYQIQDLDERFRAFAEERAYNVGSAYTPLSNSDLGHYVFRIEKPRVPNREWGVLVGEVVHNLRSALDQAVYAASVSPSRANEFPVCRNPDEWEGRSSKLLKVYLLPPSRSSMTPSRFGSGTLNGISSCYCTGCGTTTSTGFSTRLPLWSGNLAPRSYPSLTLRRSFRSNGFRNLLRNTAKWHASRFARAGRTRR